MIKDEYMKKICAITMVRNDEFYLRRWVAYYGDQLGRENLRVYFDGEDQTVPDFCEGVKTVLRPRQAGNVARSDKGRIDFLSSEAALLFGQGYDLVIGTDVDEFLIVDPALGKTLAEYLSEANIKNCLSAMGVDVGQHMKLEGAIDASRPLLAQRRHAYLCSRYTKVSVIAKPLRWGSGFHRVKGCNYHIAKDLYLFHLGGFDYEMMKKQLGNTDLLNAGWAKHLHRRAKTTRIVTEKRAREWDTTIPRMRWVQQWMRQLFAWNKPWNPIVKVVVTIPERFSNII